jgi:predicted DNA-binding transcriptional regulator
LITKAEEVLNSPEVSPLERLILELVVSGKAVDSASISWELGNRQIVVSAALKSLYTKEILFRKVDKKKRRGYIYGTTPFEE